MNDHATATNAAREGVRFRGDGYTAEAGWFGPGDRPRFGWLYRPDKPAPNNVGVVIVPPFGREDICAHRTLRHLAEDSARAGFVSLRFDLDGTGDSAGDDADPDRIAAWLASIHDACDLARMAGSTGVVLVGVRLGATLACLAAEHRTDIAALVAFNAVVSGKAYLRELRAFQAAMNLQPPPAPGDSGGQESSGFLLTDPTCAALKAIDLAAEDVLPAPVIWVLERDDLPERKDWPERLKKLGGIVDVQRVPGYADMLNDPHANRIAQTFIDACVACARSLPGFSASAVSTTSPLVRPRVALNVGGVAITEEVLTPGAGLFGILALPGDGNIERAVLMLNAGAIRHIGSNRMDVLLARQLASAGLAVLRADLTGMGDSPARTGAAENIVYGPHCLEDVGLLVAWLRGLGARNLAAGGMCSGAYHVLRAMIARQAIDRAYLINCLAYGPTVAFDPEGSGVLGAVAHYDKAVRSGHAWRRLLTGRVAFRAVTRVALWHLANVGKRTVREIARRLRIPLRDDLGTDLLAIARRGGRIDFLFCAGETGLTLLAAEAGSVVPKLRRTNKLGMRVLQGPDHTFTQRWAQAMLRDELIEILTTAPVDRPPR
ncbi:MAG TPA: hypothetical protein VHD89_09150 [Rhodanobacteraceae bacterium]|nr:hypothetical protein [Rhodanobacteraceae bacterium]